MRPKQFAGIVDFVRTPQRSPASQRRGVRRTADLPVPSLRAAATVPFARARLGTGCALPATRVRQFRGRDNPAASKSHWVIFAGREGSVTTTQRQWRLQRLQEQQRAILRGAHAPSRAGERVPRSRTFLVGSAQRWNSRWKESSFRRDAETRHARRVRSPELIGGDDAYARGRQAGETAVIHGRDLCGWPPEGPGGCCAGQNRIRA